MNKKHSPTGNNAQLSFDLDLWLNVKSYVTNKNLIYGFLSLSNTNWSSCLPKLTSIGVPMHFSSGQVFIGPWPFIQGPKK